MAKYKVVTNATMNTAKTLGSVQGGATLPRRVKILDLEFGCDGTPGDTAMRFALQRFTVAGTFTAVTPVAVDPADAASVAAAGQNHTVEPTYTASTILKQVVLNQRSSYRWFAAPYEELVTPATAANGIGWLPAVSPALSGWVTATVDEQ